MTYSNFSDHLPFNHPSRLYERARKASNSIQEMGLSTDRKVIGLQRQLRHAYPLPDMSSEIDMHRARMRRTLKENKFDGSSTWTDYYRLHAHHDLLDKLVYAPIIFERYQAPDNIEYQEALVSDVYEQNMILLKNAVSEHDHPDAQSEERERLRGAIQEQTAAALLNHAQSPYHLTLPATTISDLAHRTDLVHHTVISGEYKTVNIQMKSDRATNSRKTDPHEGGVTITSGDFGNSYADNLRTTRTLVRQFNGSANEADYMYLAAMQRRLFNKIDGYHHVDEEGIAA